MSETIGIIAGNGRFPLYSAERARSAGYRVVVAAIEKEADPVLENMADAHCWVKIGQIKKLRDFFRAEGVSKALMAGKIEKVGLLRGNVRPDLEMVKILMKTKDHRDDSLLTAIAGYLGDHGIHLVDSTLFMKNDFPGAGALGAKRPSKEILEDIELGFAMARRIAALDIGQTVVVKNKAVVAVEAVEGTDLAIRRGAELVGGQVTVVKVAKPCQDMRFDVPAVGLKTMDELIKAEARAFAFEAAKTLFLDREKFVQLANAHKIVLYGKEESAGS